MFKIISKIIYIPFTEKGKQTTSTGNRILIFNSNYFDNLTDWRNHYAWATCVHLLCNTETLVLSYEQP